jgi:FdhE protein
MNNEPSIAGELEMIDSFGQEIGAFFKRWETESLLAKQPPREATEAAHSRLAEGRYLLRPCGCGIRPAESGFLMDGLFQLLNDHLPDRAEDLEKIRQAFHSGEIQVEDFILTVLRNLGNEFKKLIDVHHLAEDLATFLAIYAARPFRVQLARFLLEDIDLGHWTRGYCPVCGHWPSLAHINGPEAVRQLWCLQCDTRWEFKRLQCVYCLNETADAFDFISLPSDTTYRMQACTICKRYLKEVRSSDPIGELPFDTVYLGTMLLDVIAAKNDYIQESPITVRYDDPDGNELLYYRQELANTAHRQ